ncbi:MAG TPA: ABC transporter permease subunit [Acetobacteraceae bacterium]|nr:ABC transporter permease subunit [Acetobacteraceae bacterium]
MPDFYSFMRSPSALGRVGVAGAWLAVGTFTAVTFLIPLALVISQSLSHPIAANYVAVLRSSATRVVELRTLQLGVIVTAICVIIGYPAAYALTRLRPFWRSAAIAAIVLPFLTSYLVRTYGWIAILGVNGPLARLGSLLGSPSGSLNGTLPGLIVAMTHMLLPLMILPVFAAMNTIDKRQLQACSSLGAKPSEAFLCVYFPQTVPGLATGVVLVFVASLGFFVTPALIGGFSGTTIAQIIFSFVNELFDFGRASSLGVLLLLVVGALFLIASRFVDLAAVFGIKERLASARRQRSRRKLRSSAAVMLLARVTSRTPLADRIGLLAGSFLAAALFILILPLVYVVLVSFQPLRLLELPTASFSLTWYRQVLSRPEWFDAARNSLVVALSATTISVVVGFFLASRAMASAGIARVAIFAVAIGPLAIPHIVLALGIYGTFLRLDLTGRLWSLALAHAIVALPYAFVNIANGLATYDRQLDRAASSLGARPFASFRRVKLPVLRTSLLTACALAFLVSLDELLITLLIAGPALPTLPVRMWASATSNISPELAVVGTLLVMVASTVFVLTKLAGLGRSGKAIARGSVLQLTMSEAR